MLVAAQENDVVGSPVECVGLRGYDGPNSSSAAEGKRCSACVALHTYFSVPREKQNLGMKYPPYIF